MSARSSSTGRVHDSPSSTLNMASERHLRLLLTRSTQAISLPSGERTNAGSHGFDSGNRPPLSRRSRSGPHFHLVIDRRDTKFPGDSPCTLPDTDQIIRSLEIDAQQKPLNDLFFLLLKISQDGQLPVVGSTGIKPVPKPERTDERIGISRSEVIIYQVIAATFRVIKAMAQGIAALQGPFLIRPPATGWPNLDLGMLRSCRRPRCTRRGPRNP